MSRLANGAAAPTKVLTGTGVEVVGFTEVVGAAVVDGLVDAVVH